MINSQKTGVGR